MKKVFFVIPTLSAFIRKDISIIKKEYKVIINKYNWGGGYKILTPFLLIHQLFSVIKNILFVDKIIIQFGGYWSLIPTLFGKLFQKQVFIILHGADCASIPSINYGSFRKKLLSLFCKISYRNATLLLPVSTSLISYKSNYYSDYGCQGIKNHIKNLKTPIKTIHNGLDWKFWNLDSGNIKEKNSFISTFSKQQFILKGGDLILSIANEFKDCRFYIAGCEKPNNIKTDIPNNIFFLGKLTQTKLREYYRKIQFTFQLSIFEGFGLALCESMLCECIPIGSKTNIIPNIIGNTGFILEKRDHKNLILLINNILQIKEYEKEKLCKLARKKIIKDYNIEKRERELLNILKK